MTLCPTILRATKRAPSPRRQSLRALTHLLAAPYRIPFYLSNRGYGVFVNNSGEVDLEVGSEKGSRVGIITRGETLEYYFIAGKNGSLKSVLDKYTQITGRPGWVTIARVRFQIQCEAETGLGSLLQASP